MGAIKLVHCPIPLARGTMRVEQTIVRSNAPPWLQPRPNRCIS